jgi:hypothetical protein
MADTNTAESLNLEFQRHPDSYLHWNFSIDGDIARLALPLLERLRTLDPEAAG